MVGKTRISGVGIDCIKRRHPAVTKHVEQEVLAVPRAYCTVILRSCYRFIRRDVRCCQTIVLLNLQAITHVAPRNAIVSGAGNAAVVAGIERGLRDRRQVQVKMYLSKLA